MRQTCEHYGYTPAEFEQLTLQQLKMLICDERELGGIVKMSRAEAARMGFI